MLGIRQVKSDGTIIELDREYLSLKKLQEMVDSGSGHKLIEFVHFIKPAYTVGERALVVNESGLLYNLPRNNTIMKAIGWDQPTPLVGDVVIIEWEQGDF